MRWSALLLGSALFLFLVYKLLRFDALGYSFNDMYAFVQMSRSWMDGRPFMYDNIWGYHHRIHNYYTMLLWGPLCYYFGAKGLFLAQVALLLLAYWLTDRQLVRAKLDNSLRFLLLVVVLLGPVSFWLNDHPNIGWHTELTYLPAALFWAVGLGGARNLRQGVGSIGLILAGLFLVLVKEDGAVLALLLHASAVALNGFRDRPARSVVGHLAGLLSQKRFWVVVVLWSVVFVAGMAWIAAKNNFAEPRLRNALHLMGTHAGEWAFWRQMGSLLIKSLMLLVPVAGVLFLLIRPLQAAVRQVVLLIWTVGVVVLTVLNGVQSAHYIDQSLFYLVAFTWPPRFVLVWGFSAGFLVLVCLTFAEQLRSVPARSMRLSVAGLWLIQLPLLWLARPDLPGPRELKAALIGPPGARMNRTFLDPADLSVIRAVARNLPPRSNVFAFDYVVPYFHKHYGIWPTGNHWQPADVAIMAHPDFQNLRPWLRTIMPGRIDSVQLKAYRIYYTPAFRKFVQPVSQPRPTPP